MDFFHLGFQRSTILCWHIAAGYDIICMVHEQINLHHMVFIIHHTTAPYSYALGSSSVEAEAAGRPHGFPVSLLCSSTALLLLGLLIEQAQLLLQKMCSLGPRSSIEAPSSLSEFLANNNTDRQAYPLTTYKKWLENNRLMLFSLYSLSLTRHGDNYRLL